MNDSLLTRAAIQGIARSGLPAVSRRLRGRGACVVMFHGVTERAHGAHGAHGALENASGLHLDLGLFRRICSILAAKYTVIPLDEMTEAMHSGRSLPHGAVVLTFDDGYASNYHLAYPVLREFGLPATIYLATDFVERGAWLWHDRVEYAVGHTERQAINVGGGPGFMNLGGKEERLAALAALAAWLKAIPQERLPAEVARLEGLLECSLDTAPQVPDIYMGLAWHQVRQMSDSGLITIGAHTHGHSILGRCGSVLAGSEIARSRSLIAERTGRNPVHFAYPNGRAGDHDLATRALLVEQGFRSAMTTEAGFNPEGGDPFALKRIGCGIDHRHLDVQASGALELIAGIRGRLGGLLPRSPVTVNPAPRTAP